jgi:TPP-dependent indolepyruvate ferredoxin oxidoreductase alpha subunit
VLTGHEALTRALVASRVRRAFAPAWPGAAPLQATVRALGERPPERPGAGRIVHLTANEPIAAAMAIAGALLDEHPTVALLGRAGLPAALPVLASLGLWNELRSAALVVEGVAEPDDGGPLYDTRAALADVALLPQLEAATADELHQLARIGLRLSSRTHAPVLLRAHRRALDGRAAVAEMAAAPPPRSPTFARHGGPFVAVVGGDAASFHRDKRTRLLLRLEPLADALAQQLGSDGPLAVVVAGHLPPEVQARAWARRLPVLRLGAAWPLPRARLASFLRGREQVLVLEEGQPALEEALQAFAHREGLAAQIRRPDGPPPYRYDADRIEGLLGRFGGRVRAEAQPPMRDGAAWQAIDAVVDAIGDDEGEPWPLYLARTQARARSEAAANDPRLVLLRALRKLERPTVVISDPSHAGIGALGGSPADGRLVDVAVAGGAVAATAGALVDAVELVGRAAACPPLPVALLSDAALYHGELLGIVDNAIARRELLHVVVVRRAGTPGPRLADDAFEAQLRAAGLTVASVQLDDPGLDAAIAFATSRTGPRALVCYERAALPWVDP